MKNILLLIIIATMASACNNSAPDKAHTRAMFNAGNLHVITSFANRKQQTMSVLYSNEAAKKCALSGYQNHFAGEVFKLVTYRQADNKYWYGSYINGKVLSVEAVISTGSQLSYQQEQGRAPADSLGRQVSTAERIRSILSHQPSIFP